MFFSRITEQFLREIVGVETTQKFDRFLLPSFSSEISIWGFKSLRGYLET